MKGMDHKKKSIGSVVGATVGWLSAPASGAELRRRKTVST